MSWIIEMAGVSFAALAGFAAYRAVRRPPGHPEVDDHSRALSLTSDMSMSIADSVRNPLSSLKGHAQLLSQMESSPELRQGVERIVFDAQRLESVLGDLLDLWKLKDWKPLETDPATLLRAWAQTAEPEAIPIDVGNAPETWVMDASRVLVVLDLLLRTIRSRCGRSASVEMAVRGGDCFLTVLLGSLEVAESAGPPSPALLRTPNFSSHYAIAELVALQHRGSLSVSESAQGALQFHLDLGRL